MKQCLENPPDEGVSFLGDSPALGGQIEPPLAAADAPASEKGRALLLEDDPAFRGIIGDCLTEYGYSVVSVQNGGEGIREVLARDFALVVCDFMMPGLPGDMFYRAIEKIRPALCQRFIFMTGHQSDARTEEFIKKVSGFVLRKPFPLSNLLDSIALAEVRSTLTSVFDGAPGNPDVLAAFPSASGFRTGAAACPHASAVAQILARAEAGRKSDVLPASEPEPIADGWSPAFMFAGLALLIVLMTGLWKPYWGARDRIDAASAAHRALELELTAISRDMETATASQSKSEEAQRQLAGISADRAEPRWSPALRSIVACAGLGIQLREIRAREEFGDAKKWTLRVGGISTGSVPRTVADEFRLALQRELDRGFQGSVSIRLERFEELPDLPSARPGDRRGAFTIAATIGFAGKTGTGQKDGA